MDERELKRRSRRELLKLTPVALAGAFVIPPARDWLLRRGVRLSDSASGAIFRDRHSVEIYPDSALTPLSRFPYNSYDVDDPEVDLDEWRLSVGGLVAKPGDYTLAQIQTLPRYRQNTRHVCVEG